MGRGGAKANRGVWGAESAIHHKPHSVWGAESAIHHKPHSVWGAESAIHHKPHSVHSLPGNTLRGVPLICMAAMVQSWLYYGHCCGMHVPCYLTYR